MDVIINIVEFNKIKPMSVLKNLNLCLYIKILQCTLGHTFCIRTWTVLFINTILTSIVEYLLRTILDNLFLNGCKRVWHMLIFNGTWSKFKFICPGQSQRSYWIVINPFITWYWITSCHSYIFLCIVSFSSSHSFCVLLNYQGCSQSWSSCFCLPRITSRHHST